MAAVDLDRVEAVLAARDAGAEVAEVIVRRQIEAGSIQVELSARDAVLGWLNQGTDEAEAFCAAYTQVAQAYADAASEFDLESEQEAG